MRFFSLAGALIGMLAGHPTSAHTSNSALHDALGWLAGTPSGQHLIQQAVESWKLSSPAELETKIHLGSVSRTDAVLTRHYNPQTGEEWRTREVSVVLRSGQRLEDLVLDVAHELVHATSRPSWDPYDPTLTPAKYIQVSIDGQGGEVQAVLYECRVAVELAEAKYSKLPLSRCRGYMKDNLLDPGRVRADFYRVGGALIDLKARLGDEASSLPLSGEMPRLYSSTGNAPYPVSLLREFDQMTQIACENTRRRQGQGTTSMAAPQGRRSPADEAGHELTPHEPTMEEFNGLPAVVPAQDPSVIFLKKRCH